MYQYIQPKITKKQQLNFVQHFLNNLKHFLFATLLMYFVTFCFVLRKFRLTFEKSRKKLNLIIKKDVKNKINLWHSL